MPQPPEFPAAERVRELFRLACCTARLMVGLPDYDTYVAHRRERHPGQPIMSYEEFFRERQARRYAADRPGRCC